MFNDRVNKLRQTIKQENLDAILVSSNANIFFLTGYANFSKDEREAYIFIGKDFGYIITDGRYAEAVKKEIPHLKLFERGSEKSTADLFKKHKENIKILGIEEGDLTVSEFKSVKKHFKKLKHFDVKNVRSIKTKDEIQKIKKACQIGDLTFDYILKKIKVGVSEKEIAYELENFIKNKGAENSFNPIVAFGKNSSVPHHQTNDKRLTINDKLILMDFGVNYQNYCSDMTRTIFFGKPSKEQKNLYGTVLEAQQKAVDFINDSLKKGEKIPAKDVDKVAREYIISSGYPDIPHSLGHGVGLEVHEHPHLSVKSKEELKEGMVFSIEPGIYISGFGGVRIEDLYVFEKRRLKQITTSPKHLIEV